MIPDHAEWVLFGWVLANQGGVPLPAVPVLLAAGALGARGRMSVVEVVALTVVASLCADVGWYGLGRWRGAGVLTLLGRLAPRAGAFVRRAQDGFLAHGALFHTSARFLPEMNPIAAGLAGASRMRFGRFVAYGAGSALVWSVAWIGIGYIAGDTVVDFAVRFGIQLAGFLMAAALLCLILRRARRHRMFLTLGKARITADELKSKIDRGERLAVLDVRDADEVASDPYLIPGACWIGLDHLTERLRELPRDVTVVLCGRRRKPIGSDWSILRSNVGLRLRRAGFGEVRALAGDLRAWRRRGYPIHLVPTYPDGYRPVAARCLNGRMHAGPVEAVSA
ncbi:MAG TPA: rhodanese-like domain-containing protein [Methylomirabilota bacterium]|nr:rhodanese-like domain-containing protein [Methylomirabilota bacterium]